MDGRTYRFLKEEPLYPFGYGLSYTEFAYSDLTVSDKEIHVGQDIQVSVIVENTGSVKGEEVVQVYIKDLQASVRVPHFQLCGFSKVALNPGETKKVSFRISARQMALIDDQGQCVIEPGEFAIYMGTCQPDQRSQELLNKNILKEIVHVVGEKMTIEY